jgi:general secretion pathway protein G
LRNYIERRRASEKGFTLIELLVVIVILGILAAVVVFAVGGLTDKGEKSACQTDTKVLRTAEEAYYSQDALHPGTNVYVTQGLAGAAGDLVASKLLANLPKYHIATASADGSSYTITIKAAKCGTVDASPGATATDY